MLQGLNVYMTGDGHFYLAATPANPADAMKPIVSADFLAVLTSTPQDMPTLQAAMTAATLTAQAGAAPQQDITVAAAVAALPPLPPNVGV